MKMKSLFKKITCLILFLVSGFAHATIPIQAWQHPSGASIYLVQTDAIPMIDIQIDLEVGSLLDPKDKSGVAAMTADFLNKGSWLNGKILSEAQVSDEFADQGAVFSASAGFERTSLRVRTLSDPKRRSAVIELIAKILKTPQFDEKILKREKDRTITAIQEADSKPETILGKEFDRQIYGDHPLSREITVESIKKIHAEDLKYFYFKRYAQEGAKITLVGDIDKDLANQVVVQIMSALPKNSKHHEKVPEVKFLDKKPANERLIKMTHPSQQAHISMGMPTIKRKSPDYYPMFLGNYILGGGGFVSRLMKEVRENRGLAYSVYSYISPGRYIGPFVAGMQTKKEQSDLAIDVMRNTISEFIKNGPSDAEINSAKENLINGFPLRIDSNKKILDNVANIAWNDLPLDTLDTWTEKINAVTKEQVIDAYKKYLDMDSIVTVVVGAP